MLSLIASFIWTNAPIMSAILTILFLIVIRMWSRSSSVIAKPIDKLGEKVVATGTDITNEVSDVLEGLSTTNSTSKPTSVNPSDSATPEPIPSSANSSQLDAQFFGELFLAGVASGLVIKFGWA